MSKPWACLSPERTDGRSWLIEYIIGCKSGAILIGKELIAQLDLLVENLSSPEVRFELADPHKRIKFIESECRHFEAPFAGKPFILELFQKAFVEALFGFKIQDEDTGEWVRKYQEAIFLVGRKNGKTPFMAAVALAQWFCGPAGQKIMCASNNYDQAALCWQAIDNMREESPKLAKCTRRNNTGIYWGNRQQRRQTGKYSKQNKGNIRMLSERTTTKEGRNLGVVLVDEVHEMEDDSLIMPLKQSLSTQPEPLFIELTTEGTIIDGYLDRRLREAREALRGEREAPRLLIWLYTQDGESEVWQDESSWVKSNPGLGAIKRWSYLRRLVQEAAGTPSERAFVLAKEFNIKQNNAQAWLTLDDIINQNTVDISELRGCRYIGGVDLSETTDLTAAAALVIKPETTAAGIVYRKYALVRYFIPQQKADDIAGDTTNPERKDYYELSRKGLVEIIPGNVVDIDYVLQWFWALLEDYDMQPYRIGYDQYDAKSLIAGLKDMFAPDMPERVAMDVNTLSNPMRELEADLRGKKLNYNDCELTRWCLSCTSFKQNTIGQIMPVKVQGDPHKRIDGALALMIAYTILARYRKEYMMEVAA